MYKGKRGLRRRIKDREKCDQIIIIQKWTKIFELQFKYFPDIQNL